MREGWGRAWRAGGAAASAADPLVRRLSSRGDAPLLALLTAHLGNADLNDVNKRGLTPLGEALLAGHAGAAGSLAAAGADPAPRPRGWPLLALAAAAGNAAAVRWLLQRGADARAAGPARVTPLHAAAAAGCAPAVDALLDAGADAGAVDADGRVAADLAPAGGAASEVRARLAEAGGARAAAAGKPPPASTTAAEAFATAAAAFRALSPADRVAAAARWAAAPNDAALDCAAAGHATAVFRHAIAARLARQQATIRKAVAMLHDDDDWQEWAPLARCEAAVASVRENPASVALFQSDPQIMHVLTGLRRLQAVAAANGGHKVPHDDLFADRVAAATGAASWREADAAVLASLASQHDVHVRAAAAAAAEEDEGDASRAAEAVVKAAGLGGRAGALPAPAAADLETSAAGILAGGATAPAAEREPTLLDRLKETIVAAVLRALVVAAVLWVLNTVTAPKKAG